MTIPVPPAKTQTPRWGSSSVARQVLRFWDVTLVEGLSRWAAVDPRSGLADGSGDHQTQAVVSSPRTTSNGRRSERLVCLR